jgi:hypothetical protein
LPPPDTKGQTGIPGNAVQPALNGIFFLTNPCAWRFEQGLA